MEPNPDSSSRKTQLNIAQRRPAPGLRPYVVHYGGFQAVGPLPAMRGLPSRHITVMLGLADPFVVEGVGALRSFVSGVHDVPRRIESSTDASGLHLVLTPLGARCLLGLPAGELAAAVQPLENILRSDGHELVDRVIAVDAWTQRFDLVDRFLLRRLGSESYRDIVHWAWSTITACSGDIRMGQLAETTGWSRHHLAKRFQAEIGVSPKTMARISRFERACALIRTCRQSLAHTALTAGFSDQSHLVREWQALAGCTPRTWIREELPFIQDYELAALDNVSGTG
jgi:AraC-like DNA-binding protein